MTKDANHRWVIILAGGEGVRLRDFVKEHFGSDRPKQFSAIIGTRSMLQHTMDRARKLVGPKQIRVVVCRSHLPFLERELKPRERETLVILPCNRETGASVLLPVLQIHHHDAEAVGAVFPSDHFILEEDHFLGYVEDAFRFVESQPDYLVLLGIHPMDPDPEYGWIEVHPSFLSFGSSRFYKVTRFHEKPDLSQASRLYRTGCLWNSMVLVARCSTLLAQFRKHLPEIYGKLKDASVRQFGPNMDEALESAFANISSRNISKHLLEKIPERLRVLRVDGVHWSDWGNPDRILGDLVLLGLPLPDGRRKG